ncbi:hypothetical protein FRD01_23165 [Microvenator marinus]|uniref:Uncharacterized protein n=1 Tax=Microvenator marinus TaxID=2600177 RepID=A0A5B8XVZ5_9DELT|nr:hypothetical protein [Microvenator marinus]QED30082.1 hypothetical protein FRD01_23165 [Microvenator marinus]
MPEFFSYSIQDFIPFNADAYVEIFVSQFEDYFPLHVASIAAALFAVYALRGNKGRRLASALMVCVLVGFVGWDFFGGRYSVLNWAASYFVWAFYGLGVLSGVSIAAPPKLRSHERLRKVSFEAGPPIWPGGGEENMNLWFKEFKKSNAVIYMVKVCKLDGGIHESNVSH